MIKAIIIDDEMHSRKTLHILLKEYCPQVEIVEQCSDAEAGMEAIGKFSPDLVFLDIEMPYMNGFEMLQQLPQISFAVIFITGYDQYAIKAFRYSALDYLLKPVEPKELIAAVHKIEAQKKLPEAELYQMLFKQMQSKEHHFNKIALPTAGGLELVPADQLMWCQADDNYTHLYFKSKNKIIACRTLREIEDQLKDFNFFIRVHHSHIVNINEIVKYVRGDGGHVILSDGTSVNVSKNRKDILLKTLKPDKH